MTRQRIEVTAGTFYTVNFDDPFPLGMRLWGVIQARLVDNGTGEPVLTPVTIRLDPGNERLRVVMATDGWVALAGRPVDLFPNLSVQPYTVAFTIYAGGYQALALAPVLAAIPGFPNTFQPLNLGDVPLLPV